MELLRKIRVLIVDDSALMRRAIKQILLTDAEIEVVGTARDGEDAILKTRELAPDVITMDINMPSMDGITSMQYILEEYPHMPILIVSSISKEGALVTFEALELGAFDYILKPSGTVSSNIYVIGREIISKVKSSYKYFQKSRIRNNVFKNKASESASKCSPIDIKNRDSASKVVVIGISTGGPKTLSEILPMVPANLDASIIIVQHMPPSFTSTFAKRIDSESPFSFKEAQPGDKIMNRKGFLAKGGYQLITKNGVLRLSSTPKTLFMPSVNVTMESVLEQFGGAKTIGVLMTGMGDDGADAMVKIRKAGGVTIAEDESTAIVYGMPREAIERGGAEIVVPSYCIVDEIIKAINR